MTEKDITEDSELEDAFVQSIEEEMKHKNDLDSHELD
jgi:hypothetical protein